MSGNENSALDLEWLQHKAESLGVKLTMKFERDIRVDSARCVLRGTRGNRTAYATLRCEDLIGRMNLNTDFELVLDHLYSALLRAEENEKESQK